MDFDWLLNILKSPVFYGILLGLVLLAWGVVGTWFKKVNLRKGQVMLIAIVGLFLAMGGASLVGVGSTGGSGVSDGIVISGLQTTTAYVVTGVGASATNIADVGTDDTKQSDFYLNETHLAGNAHIDTGVWKITRSGKLDADSCKATIKKPARYDISDTTYHIVDENADTGVMFAYIVGASSSTAAANTHSKETTMVPFAEGVAEAFVGINITIDETGFDPLSQYDTKSVQVDVCGYPYTVVIHKDDA